MADAAINLNFNVVIKVVDKQGRVVQQRHVHNKASRSLVSGIIQFLQGVFNPSEFNDPMEKYSNPEQAIINNAYGAKKYLPSCTGVGTVGVVITPYVDPDTPRTVSITETDLAKPTFYESALQREYNVPRIKFRRVRAGKGFDTNNSENLILTTVLPKGYLVVEYEDGAIKHHDDGTPVYRDTYFDYYGEHGDSPSPKKAMLITEIGLFSNTDPNAGLLLARVVLDGELADGDLGRKGVMKDEDYEYNPLVQTEDTSVIIEWRIGIISVGTNDEFVVESIDTTVPMEDMQDYDEYAGPYEAESYTNYQDSLATANKIMTRNVVIYPITTTSTHTESTSGNTMTIGIDHVPENNGDNNENNGD